MESYTSNHLRIDHFLNDTYLIELHPLLAPLSKHELKNMGFDNLNEFISRECFDSLLAVGKGFIELTKFDLNRISKIFDIVFENELSLPDRKMTMDLVMDFDI